MTSQHLPPPDGKLDSSLAGWDLARLACPLVTHPLPEWASDVLLGGNVDDWEQDAYALRLRALALDHAVRAHDEVMHNRDYWHSSEYSIRSPAAPLNFQPVQQLPAWR